MDNLPPSGSSSTNGKSTLITTAMPTEDGNHTTWSFKIENPRTLREDVLAEVPQIKVDALELQELRNENAQLKEKLKKKERKMAEMAASNDENVQKFSTQLNRSQAANIALRKQLVS